MIRVIRTDRPHSFYEADCKDVYIYISGQSSLGTEIWREYGDVLSLVII